MEQISRDLRCLIISRGSKEILIDMVGKMNLLRSFLCDNAN